MLFIYFICHIDFMSLTLYFLYLYTCHILFFFIYCTVHIFFHVLYFSYTCSYTMYFHILYLHILYFHILYFHILYFHILYFHIMYFHMLFMYCNLYFTSCSCNCIQSSHSCAMLLISCHILYTCYFLLGFMSAYTLEADMGNNCMYP